MRVITKEEVELQKDEIKDSVESGSIFIHPTDTIYGIGCSALDSNAVKKIREIKKRYTRPFSIIAPSVGWIEQNCEITKEAKKWLKKLPGPFTLILKLKNKECIAPNVNTDLGTLGIRIPQHWVSEFVKELGIPIVTTSANIVGENHMTSIDDLNPEIKKYMNCIVYEGEKKGSPSKLIDLTAKEAKIKER